MRDKNIIWAKNAAQVLIDNMTTEELQCIIEKKIVFKLFKDQRDAPIPERRATDVLNGYYSSLIRDQLYLILINKQKSKA